MTNPNIESLLGGDQQALAETNRSLEPLSAQQRVRWALEYLPGRHVISSSFGIQAALMLHLLTRERANIPVILIDTGYLFPQTYGFVDRLQEHLQLNLKIYRSELTPAWQEARLGRLWEQGLEGLNHYNRLNKVEPMQRALAELEVGTWFAGLRRQQSNSRSRLPVLRIQEGRFKLHPIIDWNNRDVHHYLRAHDLPYHPLWEQGYVSVGDTHSTRPLSAGMREEETRFFGLKRECGLHN